MQKCSSCGAELPDNSRFCGKCGSVQDALATDAATTGRTPPQPHSWAPQGGTRAPTWPPSSTHPAQGSAPAWSSNVQAPGTPLPPWAAENEDERRRGIPPWTPLYGAALGGSALLGSEQASTPGAPVAQGTPQIGSAPSVAGSPTPYAHAPGSPSAQAAGNVPISHPVQGTGNVPISHPVQRPQPTPHPPEQPGTQEHHPPHKLHRHHPHPLEHEPHRHHTHAVQHELRREGAAKVAGGSTKTIILVVAAVAVIAAGGIGAAAHFLSHPQPLIAKSHGTATATSQAQVNSSPTPTRSPQANYPQLKASYSGTAHNTTVNIIDNVSLTSIKQNGQQISGYCTKGSKLFGSGPFTGTIDASGNVQLTVQDSKDSVTTYFRGTLSNGILQGTYKVTYPFYPQDPNYPNPQYGSWFLS